MEPNLQTAPHLLGILEELKQHEPIFHRPEHGTTRRELADMMAQTFWETGASGRRYSREYCLDILEQRLRDPVVEVWATSEFHCMEIAPDNYLLTYTLLQGERLTRRATIWRRMTAGWKIVYHHGTVVADHKSGRDDAPPSNWINMHIESSLLKPIVDAILGLARGSSNARLKRDAAASVREAIRELLLADPNESEVEAKIAIAKAAGLISEETLLADAMLRKVRAKKSTVSRISRKRAIPAPAKEPATKPAKKDLAKQPPAKK